MTRRCSRCAVLEDLLETARIQVEHARKESEKADDEALDLKRQMLDMRAKHSGGDARLVRTFIARAEAAEAALAAAASGGDVKQAPGEAPQSGPNGDSGNAHTEGA